jgi:taurine dioxygenase
MHDVPPAGGDTMFASMYAAYDALSDRMKGYLEGMTAVHDGAHIFGAADFSRRNDAAFPRSEHPIVRTHPESGRKCLFVNRGFTTRIVGVPRDESDTILDFLYRHMEHPNFQVRFTWQTNSVAFWDNNLGLLAAPAQGSPRDGERRQAVLSGDRPF